MGRRTWPLVLLVAPLLAGCAAPAAAPLPATLTSMVPTTSFDRTDMPCYYGVVW
jgi:hypothetical protein